MDKILEELKHAQLLNKISQLLLNEQGKVDLLQIFFEEHCGGIEIYKEALCSKIHVYDKAGEVMFITELHIMESHKNLDFLLENILEYCRNAGINLIETTNETATKPKEEKVKKEGNVLIFPSSDTKH